MPSPSASRADRWYHEELDPHGGAASLSDVILGGQDGLVNVLGVVLGVAAASQSVRLVLAAGLAAALAESASMAAVAYTSRAAHSDYFRGERAREYRHIEAVPDLEREEVREIYAKRGFSGDLLDRIVDTITSDKDVWVAVMMSEELGLAETSQAKSWRSAAIVGAAALAGSLLPLTPFAFLPVSSGVVASLVVSTVSLFALGAYKAKRTVGRPFKSGLELAGIGMLAAGIGYLVGTLFQGPMP